MGAFENYLLGRRMEQLRKAAAPSAFLLPDIDAPPPAPEPAAAAPPPEPEGPTLEEQLVMAREEGFRDGLAEGEALGRSQAAQLEEARIAALLNRLAESLARSEAEWREAAEANARALAVTLIKAFDAALPAAASRLGPELIARTALSLRAALEERPEARLHVAPEMAEALSARLPHWTIESDPAIPPGDARIAWRGGAATLDLAARRAAIRDALAALDLAEPEEAP